MTLPFESLGLPSTAQFAQYRVWDSYYHPTITESRPTLESVIAADLAELKPFAIERFCTYFHVGLGTVAAGSLAARAHTPAAIRSVLQAHPERLTGFMFVNPHDVPGTLRALDEWVGDGPLTGIFFLNSRTGLRCTHPNFEPIIRRASELGAVIMQHTWFKAGGREFPGESTPSDLAEVAARHPQTTFIAAHAGGDWQLGIAAVRAHPNVWIETSGFDPTQGFIEMAVRELGAGRIVFGGHFMSRSVGTEFSKIIGDEITEPQRAAIFGGNLRRLMTPILRRKGVRL